MSKILVIGDTCKDVFVYCNCDRLCPEAPVPLLDIVEEEENLGMAGNVQRNILCLGADSELVTNLNFTFVTKTRYVDKKTNHLFSRIDSKTKIERIQSGQLQAIDWKSYDAVVISDYNKGFLTVDDIIFITTKHPLTFLDTKKILGSWATYATFIKINTKEFNDSAEKISEYALEDSIIQTLGAGGCKFRDKVYPVKGVDIKNLSGAGDSFLAALVVKFLENKSIDEALVAANEAATIVVQKKGVSLLKD